MIKPEWLDHLKAHGAQLTRSVGASGVALSELLLVAYCEIDIWRAREGQAWKVEGARFPRALLLTQAETMAVMSAGLASAQEARLSARRWSDSGQVVYHNFLRRLDGSVVMDTLRGERMLVGDPVGALEYARGLTQSLGPLIDVVDQLARSQEREGAREQPEWLSEGSESLAREWIEAIKTRSASGGCR